MTRAAEVARLLHVSAAYRDPNPGRRHISGQVHALRVGGILQALAGDEAGLVGLVHDLARPLSDAYHGEVIAEVVRDRVSPDSYYTLRDHGLVQAAALRGAPAPASGLDSLLCDAELASFADPYAGPAYNVRDAERVIARWLA